VCVDRFEDLANTGDTPVAARRGAALITGASSGIGRALAVALAEAYSPLILLGRDRERLTAVAREVEARGAEAQIELADFAQPATVNDLGKRLAARLSVLALLIHAAGDFSAEPVAQAEPGTLARLLAVNLESPHALTRALIRALGAGPGDLLFINSSAVRHGRAGLSAYTASKAGLLALADTLRQELNPLGVRVSSVFLGATATPMQARICAAEGRPYRPELLLQPNDIAALVRAALQLPRSAELTDLHLRPTAPHRS
jgi:short-subunit dehydrogenase